MKNEFLKWDDDHFITENSYLLKGQVADTLFKATYGVYQPVVNATFLLEYKAFGLNAVAFHTTNIVLHVLNCLLVFWLILLIGENIPVALVTALLFGLHPLRVESVAWVSERKDVLYSFFFLLTLISYYFYLRRYSVARYSGTFVLFILSMGSKVFAAPLPVVLLAMDYLLGRKWDRRMFLEKIPFFLLAVGGLALAVRAQEGGFLAGEHGQRVVFQFFEPFYGLGLYLLKTLAPVNLSVVYPYPPRDTMFYVMSAVSILLFCLIAAAAISSMKYTKKFIFGFLFAILMVLPVLQILPFLDAIIAERYTYIPAVGVSFVTAVGFFYFHRRLSERDRLLGMAQIAALTLVLFTLAFLTFQRTLVWKDTVTVLSNAISQYPGAYALHNNRGIAYLDRGDLDHAFSDFDMEIKINPYSLPAYNNRGVVYKAKGDFESAIEDFTTVIDHDPTRKQSYEHRAECYFARHEYANASEDVRQAQLLGGTFRPEFIAELQKALAEQKQAV